MVAYFKNPPYLEFVADKELGEAGFGITVVAARGLGSADAVVAGLIAVGTGAVEVDGAVVVGPELQPVTMRTPSSKITNGNRNLFILPPTKIAIVRRFYRIVVAIFRVLGEWLGRSEVLSIG